jgi:hypothetical protein
MKRKFYFYLSLVICLIATTSFAERKLPNEFKWYENARFGLFYHWGLFTGGGSSTTGSKTLPFYKSVDEFEKAAGSPEKFAKNLVALTKDMGGAYLTLTLMHSCDKHMVIFPTKNPAFKYKTKNDYFGAVLKEAHKQGIKVIVYFPAHADHYKSDTEKYIIGLNHHPLSKEGTDFWYNTLNALFKEMKERYGENSIDGFWMDGFISWQPVINSFPKALRIGNNQVTFSLNPMPHFSTTEFLTSKCEPAYNRVSGLLKPNLEWGDDNLSPRKDFNEDIPTCNGWWYGGGKCNNEYVKDHTFLVKQILCSLGLKRKWNFTLGLGPLVDGTIPPEFKPMAKTVNEFFKWAKPAIYNTTGGIDDPLHGGWLNSGAFGVVTIDNKEPNTYYLSVLEPPTKFTKTMLKVQHDWVKVKSITDLRTGKPLPFNVSGTINITSPDWTDIQKYGAKIFKIVLEK